MTDDPVRDGPAETSARPFDVGRVLVWAVVVAIVAVAIGAAFLLPRRGDVAPARSGTAEPVAVAPGGFEDEPGEPPPPTTGLFGKAVGTWIDVPAVERSGVALRTHDLLGRWLVVDFVFASCGGTCPPMQEAMSKLQEATTGDRDLRLVSVSVDPARDTPEALRTWADAYGADRTRWLFLRIEEPDLRRLMGAGMKVPTADDLLMHSGLFLLVDPAGDVRGRYSPLQHPNWKDVLLADLAKLRSETPPR